MLTKTNKQKMSSLAFFHLQMSLGFVFCTCPFLQLRTIRCRRHRRPLEMASEGDQKHGDINKQPLIALYLKIYQHASIIFTIYGADNNLNRAFFFFF